MVTNIYEKFKKFIKENYKGIIVYVIVFVILTFRLPFYIYIGGGIIDLDKRIDMEGNETGSYNMAYVKEMHATIPTYLLSFIIPSWDLLSVNENKIDESEDIESIETRDKLYRRGK